MKNYFDILIFGDSHAKCFEREREFEYDGFRIKNTYISSASARGLVNPNSKLKAGQVIFDTVDQSEGVKFCVLKFCQVDIEYNYYHKVFKKKEDIDKVDFFKSVMEDYIQFIILMNTSYPEVKTVVCGVNVPNRYDWWMYLKKLGVSCPEISYEERMKDHIQFNEELKKECENHGVMYFDTTEDVLEDGRLKDQFVGEDNHFSGAEWFEKRDLNTYSVFLKKLIQCLSTSVTAEKP